MSEEEIINKAKLIINNHREIDKMMVIEMVELVQGLLDLYNKEKEKNKELEMQLLEKDLYIDGLKEDRRIAIKEIQEEYYISKDKIREKMDCFDKELQKADKMGDEELKERIFCATSTLYELLEERK